MLILTRNAGESIIINDDIVVTVLGVKGLQTKIGVKAAKDVPVHREEIYQKIQEELAHNKSGSQNKEQNNNSAETKK